MEASFLVLFVCFESAEVAAIALLVVQIKSKVRSQFLSLFTTASETARRLCRCCCCGGGGVVVGPRRGTCHNHIKALHHRDEREDDSPFRSGTGKGND